MSEPKLISPLLDGFVMGDPISSHDGVRCCPAMQMDSDKKYIVKVISVPASQVKLDALLLAGAFRDSASAGSYFKDLAEGVVEEAVLLQRLSRLEGFISYENWQIVPMEDGEVGFDVYLTGSYRHTLERHFRRMPMTHLGAVNLGLDMCAALAVCRRSGYLYVDLKPANIYICDDREYRIGDLGFLPMASLEYASLPERYVSAYTAPEITDAYSALNDTLDVYAAGLILYQAYNGGMLPFEGRAPSEPLSAPLYADSEMAQIILKACDPNPEVRWRDPLQMGQALVSYLQSNSVNDTPIVASTPMEAPETTEADTESLAEEEPSTEVILAQVDEALDAVGGAEEIAEAAEITISEESQTASEIQPADEEAQAPAEKALEAEHEDAEASEETEPDSDDPSAVNDSGETDITAEAAALQEELGVSEEVSHILAQADDLIAHETPEPVVAPEPIDVPIPVIVVDATEDAESIVLSSGEETSENETECDCQTEPENNDVSEEMEDVKSKKSHRGWIAAVITLVLLAGLAIGGYLFYENYYLQTILDISVDGVEDNLTVSLHTETDDALLTVLCTDTYGNTTRKSVTDGKAIFQNLNPATRYKISVEISGFHKLIGTTTEVYVTAEQTSIVSFTAATGAEDGSVILNFTIQGPETGEWKVFYSAEGEEEKSVTFTGHMVTINGLTTGNSYTFRLEPASPLYIVGTDTITYTASNIIYAEDLSIQGFRDNALTAIWNAPQGIAVESWIVRCYNDAGYDKTITTTETKAVFEDLDNRAAYTIEVNAEGMTMGTRAFVSANSVTIPSVQIDDTNRNQLSVSWDFEGTDPEGGWLLLYSIDGSDEQQVVKCTENAGVIFPVVPGSHYSITIQPANGSTVFGGTCTYEAPSAEPFSGYLVSASDMVFKMCKTPKSSEWGQYDVPAQDYTTTFDVGTNASFAVFLNHEYNTSSDEIITLFVIRDAQGNVLSTATQSRTWTSMWYRGFGRINIPPLPQKPGSYTLDIYFNGASVTTQQFTII